MGSIRQSGGVSRIHCKPRKCPARAYLRALESPHEGRHFEKVARVVREEEGGAWARRRTRKAAVVRDFTPSLDAMAPWTFPLGSYERTRERSGLLEGTRAAVDHRQGEET
jgi:hypothetical protein